MSKLYQQAIEVRLKNGFPVTFRWRRRWYQVTSCTVHKELPSRLQWWKELGPPVYRCETRQGLACELVERDGMWLLERVWD